jgi:hypothetical protein
MKKCFAALAVLLALCTQTQQLSAQCPGCTPDETCISADGLPTVCPLELPPATAGTYYEDYLTFYLPAEVNDVENGIQATLLEVTISSVTGLPFGMDFTVNDDDATYFPSEGENFGCATLCGTPILPGTYSINITVDVVAVAFGFEVEQAQSFFYTFIVEPGSGGNSGFAFSSTAGCGSFDVTFEALINLPSVTTYFWDFGNGQTSTEQFPAPVTFSGAGDYNVTLTTTVLDYTMQSLNISSLDDNWDGDVDDIFSPPADVFFVITDGDGAQVYTSGTVNNNNTPSWSGINVVLNNPPYEISFTDVDDISADDPLGTAALTVQDGAVYFDTGSGTIGTASIALEVTGELFNEEVITVFPLPDAQFETDGSLLFYDDPTLASYFWFLNELPIDGAFGSSLEMTTTGFYSAEVTNLYGCTAMSEEVLWCPDIVVLYDAGAEVVYLEGDYETYQWYFNGAEIEGANTFFTDASEPGNYSVFVTTADGCATLSETFGSGVGDDASTPAALELFPNPAGTEVFVSGAKEKPRFFDLSGRPVSVEVERQGLQWRAGLESLPAGVYLVVSGAAHMRLIKQ